MRALLGAAVVAVLLTALPAAAETVRFPSATTPPTPLQQRLFRERGQPIAVQPITEITGEFYRPAGDGPFPAVVQLHGCDGRGSRLSEDAEGASVVALGYALLIVDSFGPRGAADRCGGESGPPVDRVMDAYGALLWLARQPFVDPDRIAVVGYSQGAMIALSAVARGGVEALFGRHFRAAIAYYPSCDISRDTVTVPTLILIGELDDWTPARDCRTMMTQRSGEGAPIRLVVYPGAYHAFNFPRDKPQTYFGHRLEYNEAAAKAALAETIAALRQAFGR